MFYLCNLISVCGQKSRGLVFGAILLALCGCGSSPPPIPFLTVATPTATPLILPTPPPAFTVHRSVGFQIALPDSWKEIALDEYALKNSIDAASNENPHLADTLRGILESGQSKSLAFYAADTQSTNVVSNLALARGALASGASLEQSAQDYATALPGVLKGAKVLNAPAVFQVNGLSAAEVDYDLPLVNSSGQLITLRGVQFFYATRSGELYVATLTGDGADAEKFTGVARQIGNSFVVVGK